MEGSSDHAMFLRVGSEATIEEVMYFLEVRVGVGGEEGNSVSDLEDERE